MGAASFDELGTLWDEQLKADVKKIHRWWLEHESEYSDLHLTVQPWGLRWSRAADEGKKHLIPVLELRPMRDGRWVALCLKYSTAQYSRNVYSYGGMFIQVKDNDSIERLSHALTYLQAGFAPSKRPVLVRKTLRIDLRELHEAGQEGYSL